ncbi:MAG: hypothetical protein QM780_16425 [Hyphomicrobium sp.]|uniref:hypothetical protein n=1 Tax=Hyphomicrobium sp. TaxID=82 RepID=UPI0039E65FF3
MTKLRYLGWEGYADGNFADALRRDTGLEIEGENHLSDDLASRTVQAAPAAWDIVNINTPFVRDVLHTRGIVRPLPDKFEPKIRELVGVFSRFKAAAEGPNGEILGIPQRCGPFNLVINRNRLSPALAREHGFSLALNRDFYQRFGILAYEDFNAMHIAIAAGLNPFEPLDDPAIAMFSDAARSIFRSARTVTPDHNLLNQALVDGDIDFYISGGTYTASPARLSGRVEVRAITPENGPISGKGGVAFVEINALINHAALPFEAGEIFLDYIASESGAVAASLAAGACNPVAQMHRASVFNRFDRAHLDAMQWDDFEEDMSRCADYAIMPNYPELLQIVKSSSQYD